MCSQLCALALRAKADTLENSLSCQSRGNELGHPRSFGPTPFVLPLLFFTCRQSHSCLSAAPARPPPPCNSPRRQHDHASPSRPAIASQIVIKAKISRRCQKLRRSGCKLRHLAAHRSQDPMISEGTTTRRHSSDDLTCDTTFLTAAAAATASAAACHRRLSFPCTKIN